MYSCMIFSFWGQSFSAKLNQKVKSKSSVFLYDLRFLREEYFIRQIAVTVMDEQGRVEVMNPHIQNMEVTFQLAKNTNKCIKKCKEKKRKSIWQQWPLSLLISGRRALPPRSWVRISWPEGGEQKTKVFIFSFFLVKYQNSLSISNNSQVLANVWWCSICLHGRNASG